uniref:Uncharacterized protein n=1 Tax=Haptolina brevifila TaxID=156173 RepID=A0A7S2E118_9EUKA
MQPPRLIVDMFPDSPACIDLLEAVELHAARGRCSYRCISGWCDPVVRPDSAFALRVTPPSVGEAHSRHEASCHTLLLANEGHFTITMSDRLISTVVQWTADCLDARSR